MGTGEFSGKSDEILGGGGGGAGGWAGRPRGGGGGGGDLAMDWRPIQGGVILMVASC